MMFPTAALTFALSPVLLASAPVNPDRECATRAAQEWAQLHGNTDGAEVTPFEGSPRKVSYQHHYNATLDKCAYIESIQWNDTTTVTVTELTADKNRVHIQRGTFTEQAGQTPLCDVYPEPGAVPPLTRHCRSKTEWQQLMKPYIQQ